MKLSLLRKALLLCVILVLSGCQGAKPESLQKLVIGLMPAVDAAPIFIAEQEGYFKDLGLDVELTVFTNAMDRQTALQSGRIDGTISDIVALINNVQNGFPLKATSCTDGSFLVVTKKDFDDSVETLKVGIMEVSVVNYVADRFLSDQYTLDKQYINEIPARMEMLSKGQIDVAILPEPIASNAELIGLPKLEYQMEDAYSPELMVFTQEAITKKSTSIQAFYTAYNKAVEVANKDTSLVRDILVEKIGVQPEAKDLMILPLYQKAVIPDEEYVKKLVDWASVTLGQTYDVTYKSMMDTSFVK